MECRPASQAAAWQDAGPFDDALKAVNAEVGASQAFARGYDLSRKAFEELGSAVKAYDIDVVRLDDGQTHLELYRWFVKDGPKEDVWMRVFAPLYSTSPVPCPFLDRLTVDDRHTGLAQPRGVATSPTDFSPCPCKIGNDRGRTYDDDECGEPQC